MGCKAIAQNRGQAAAKRPHLALGSSFISLTLMTELMKKKHKVANNNIKNNNSNNLILRVIALVYPLLMPALAGRADGHTMKAAFCLPTIPFLVNAHILV